jgi:hypothetical protein
MSRTKSLIESNAVSLPPASGGPQLSGGEIETETESFSDHSEHEEFQVLPPEKDVALLEGLMTVRLALQLDPLQCILDDDVDLSKTINLVRPVILPQTLGERAQALVTHGLAGDPPSADEVRLIAAAMQKMEI